MKQLAIANKSVGGGVIVVLAEKEKEEMELDIGKLEFDFMGTSVICRSGSPLILADLKKVLMGVLVLSFRHVEHLPNPCDCFTTEIICLVVLFKPLPL